MRNGTFGGFAFDPEVFASYMAEQPTWSNAIIASGILQEDSTIMDLIGSRGNVATLPFYKALDIDDFEPYNNDGLTDNVPQEITGGKQTAMLIQRMMAWKAKDFVKELSGADPIQHVANSINNYYNQVWQAELMNIVNAVMSIDGMAGHLYDISAKGADMTEDNKVNATTLIYAQQKALGDASNGFGLAVMHSAIYAAYKALGLVEFTKYSDASGLAKEIELPTINGLVVVQDDRHTVDLSGDIPKYITTIAGRGAILTARKTNYEDPYYTDYDPESSAGVEKLYTKEGRVIHPNGFNFDVNNVATESPTKAELGTADNWTLAFDAKNVKIGQIISNG